MNLAVGWHREPMKAALVEGEGRIVAEHVGAIAPEPRDDDVLVLARWELDEPVHATPCPVNPARRPLNRPRRKP
ncbi:MAG: hypothetical protein V4850_35570, partial [Myxococcota bacterium]